MSRTLFHLLALLSLLSACVPHPNLTPTRPALMPTVRPITPTVQAEMTPTVAAEEAEVSAPYVTARQPGSGVVADVQPVIAITFSRDMDQASVAAALTITPEVDYTLRWKAQTLHIDVAQTLEPGVYYRIEIDAAATDTDGVPLRAGYHWTFKLADALARALVPAVGRPAQKIELYFNYPMNIASVEESFALSPELPGTWAWNEKHTVAAYSFAERYEYEQTYTITFIKPLRIADGIDLPQPSPIEFTAPSAIVAFHPSSGLGANPGAPIRIRFDVPVDRASVESAFNLSPALSGKFVWDGETLEFRPERGYFDEYTDYTVTLSPSLTDSDGRPLLRQPFARTFRTGDLPDTASFGYGPNAQVVDADGRRAVHFVVEDDSVDAITFELYQLNVEQFLDRYSSSFRGVVDSEKRPISLDGAKFVQRWQIDTPESNGNDYLGALAEVLIPADVPTGLYVLNIAGPRLDDQLIVVLTRRAVMVKQAEGQLAAWVTDVNGGPAPDVRVGVYARDGLLLAEGRTDESGLFRAEVNRDPQPLIVVAGEGDDISVSGLSNEWRSRLGQWWGWWQPAPTTQRYAAHIYTDRPIYKPGQTIYFKAIVREDDDAVLDILPEGSTVIARMRDSRNNVVRTQQLTTNQFGTLNGEFTVAEGATLGEYAIEIEVNGESHRQIFKVQDYRKPDYEVTVTTDSDKYVAGDTVRVTVDTRYFYGEPVADAEITIRQYDFGRDWICYQDCREVDTWFDLGERPITGRTDANGRFTFTVKAELAYHSDNWYWWSNIRHSTIGIEATVDDGSHQTVSSFSAIKVFSADEQVRMDAGSYLQTPGQTFNVRATVRDLFDQPVSGRNLTLQLRKWNSTNYDYSTVIQSATLTTGADGRASTPFAVPASGFYQLHLAGKDRLGNSIEFNRWVWAIKEADQWTGGSNGLTITADRDSYAPGETATLIVETPVSGPALLTFERGSTRREQFVELTAPITRLEVPIRPDDAPNIFATINVWQAQDTSIVEPDSGGCDYWARSVADSRLLTATTELHVPVTDKTLTVTLVPDKDTYAPREQAVFTVRVTNGKGEPVAAEVSLALVDESIFSLSDELSGPIFDAFYFERDHIVRTYNTMAPYRYLPGGCGGGGGGGGFNAGNPRSNFPDTAAWVPVLHTDWKGEATVTVALPDSLTSWRLTAKATTSDTQVGEAIANVITKQPIVIRPLIPRALTEGDRVVLSALVHNYTDSTQTIMAELNAGDLIATTDSLTRALTLPAGGQSIVGWAVTAAKAGEAPLTFTAHASPIGDGSDGGGGLADAVRVPLTIHPLAVPDVSTQVGEFSGVFNTTVTVPSGASDLGAVRVELSRSIAGTLLNGLEFLTGFPYGCVEQTMSRALPNAVVGRAFHQLGVGNPTAQADLPPRINASIQRLYGYQHNDGGWGWWFDDESDAYQTAWVIFGLSVTAEAGYEVDSGVIRRGTDWLSANLKSMDERTRAYALYSMAVAGYGDIAATQTLAARANSLDPFSQAALALALHKLGATSEARKALAILEQTAVVKDGKVYWIAANGDGYYHEKTMASTVRSTALALSAFAAIDPNHRLEPGIARYLMSQRTRNGWGTTNETSFTILALTDHLLAKETAIADTEYTVQLNGQTIANGRLGRGEPAVSLEIPAGQLKAGDNAIRIVQSGEGLLYYVISSRMYLKQTAIDPAGNLEIGRDYLDPKTNKPLAGPVTAGQLVKVVLSVRTSTDIAYVIVEDKLPGGLEALNEGLNTTSHDAQALDWDGNPYYYWRELGYNNKEVWADRVSFFITEMDAGRHTFTYYARAVRSGTFVALPAEASAMYDLSVWGRGRSDEVMVEEK